MHRVRGAQPDDQQGLAAALGLLGAVAVPMALGPVREWVGPANVALLLGAVVVATGAVGGRRAGITNSVVAVLGYDVFHTRPYLSLHVEAGRDLVTLALLLAAGLVASEAAHRVRVTRRQAETAHLATARLGDLVAHPTPRDHPAVAAVARSLIARQLPGVEAIVEVPAGPDPIASVRRDGTVDPEPGGCVHTAAALHRGPVAVPIALGDESFGRIVVSPSAAPLDHDDWLTFTILADHVALALAGSGPR